MLQSHWLRVALVAAFALWAGQSHAAHIDLQLSGLVGDVGAFDLDFNQFHIDIFQLRLAGLPDPSTLNVLDTVTATITLDRSLTIPPALSFTAFVFVLEGDFGSSDIRTLGTTTFSNLGVDGPTLFTGGASTGALTSGFFFAPPNNGAITFDKIVSSFSIEELSQSGNATSAQVLFELFSPLAVPEPPPAVLVFAALGLIGASRWRRSAA